MLKKYLALKWTVEAKRSFEAIKEALTKTPVPISHDFQKDFIIFSFASEHTIATVLLQKNDQGYQQPIAFFSKSLRDYTLKYNIMEKQALALVKAIKEFIVYILYSHIIAYVPNLVVKDILAQDGPEGNRGKWIATILEYDIEIKPKKLIKGQGLAKLMTESNYRALDINFIGALDDQEEKATPQISKPLTYSPWYADIIFVLLNLQAPPSLSRTKGRFLDNALFWKENGGILLNCLLKDEVDKVMQEFHAGDCGGHPYWKTTADKILRAGFYQPTLL